MSDRGCIGAAGLAALDLLALGSAWPNHAPLLLWNTTASAPVGLYKIDRIRRLSIDDWVAVRPPKALALMLARRGVLPLGVPLLKQVAALAPSAVCRFGRIVWVAGREVALAEARDREGKALPTWSGCRRLGPRDVFLLTSAPGSFDSRYFGPLRIDQILGQARPLVLPGPRW